MPVTDTDKQACFSFHSCEGKATEKVLGHGSGAQKKGAWGGWRKGS